MWHEFKIVLPEAMKEPVTAVLFGLGCQGTSDGDGSIDAFFGSDVLVGDVEAALSGLDGVTFTHTVVEEQDWYAGWKQGFRPLHACGLLICPPWLEDKPAPGERLVVLDPGQAFGTGDHVTTMTVLTMLKEWAEAQGDVSGARLLDLGTGTGILSIAAFLFGVRDITAVDNERQAVETATRNFSLNGLTDKIKLLSGSITAAGGGYDIILANIFQEALLDVMPGAATALRAGGSIIVSGLLAGQEGAVIDAAGRVGLSLVEVRPGGGWVSAMLRAG